MNINPDNHSGGMLTSIWGNHMWNSLHCISFTYPEHPTDEDKQHYKTYFQTLKYFENDKDGFISLLNLPLVETSDKKEGNTEIGIHIRRGDYLNFSKRLHVCNTDYFRYFLEYCYR